MGPRGTRLCTESPRRGRKPPATRRIGRFLPRGGSVAAAWGRSGIRLFTARIAIRTRRLLGNAAANGASRCPRPVPLSRSSGRGEPRWCRFTAAAGTSPRSRASGRGAGREGRHHRSKRDTRVPRSWPGPASPLSRASGRGAGGEGRHHRSKRDTRVPGRLLMGGSRTTLYGVGSALIARTATVTATLDCASAVGASGTG